MIHKGKERAKEREETGPSATISTRRSSRRASEIASSIGVPSLNAATLSVANNIMKQRNAYPQVSTPSVYGDEQRGRPEEIRDSDTSCSYSLQDLSTASASSSAAHANGSNPVDDEDDDQFLNNVQKEHAQQVPLFARFANNSPSPYTTPLLGSTTAGHFGSPYRDYDEPSEMHYGGSHAHSSHFDKHPFLQQPDLSNGTSNHDDTKKRKRWSDNVIEMFGSNNGSIPPSPRLGSTIGRKSTLRDWLTGRRRIPMFTLAPAVLMIAFLAGFLLGKGTLSNFGWSSFTPHSVVSSSTYLSSALSYLTRPPYVAHSSGHFFMDQTRTSLGVIEHPIYALIANATSQWNQLVTRQSKTIAQAAQEYRRRYNRRPPKGFDLWFKFARERDVVLVDEYDQIMRDIEPFLSLSPSLLHSRITTLENDPFTHTFIVRNGAISIVGAKKELARASDQAGLIKNFVNLLPDVNITMSAHDGPSVLMDWRLKDSHIQAAKSGKRLLDSEADKIDDDPATFGFQLACPPDSRLRKGVNGMEVGALPVGPSYVQDHVQTMDLCKNPEWQFMHGFTAWQGPRPRTLQPLFSFAKTSMHADLLCVPLEQFVNTPDRDPEWEDKKHNKIVWRGSMTGVWYDRQSYWRSSQRSRLHFLSQAKEGSRFVRFLERDGTVERIREEEVSLPTLNERYLDAGYVGKLHQCTPDDGGCEAIPSQPEMTTVSGMDWESQNDYKYIVDTDGNAWSGRFHRLMASNSLVLKSTIFPEWYSDRIMPWLHYVPLKIDYTDLYDLMAFFSGDMTGKNGHDALAKQIAYAGKEWTKKHWRWEDMETYAFRLYLEWARVASKDQTDVDYIG